MSEWPSSNDYTVAIQSPNICFRDVDLRRASAEKHALTRMPKVWTGNFAQVYELRNSRSRWAVKCFTRSATNLRERYGLISKAIAGAKLPYFVEFRLLDDEMLVNGKRYPVVKMEWVDGQSLDKYVESNLYHPQRLLDLAGRLLRMVKDLEGASIAHGDLQHGNILLRGTELKLVDYDGMFVPAFAGSRAPEVGLPTYQHPRRDEGFYNQTLDRFPLLVICTGLCALAVEPALWYEFSTGDNLLFKREDFENPDRSVLLKRIRAAGDKQLGHLAEMLQAACRQNIGSVPVPEATISIVVTRRVQPWWVPLRQQEQGTAASGGGVSEAAKQAGEEALASVLGWLRHHWSFASSITILSGLAALYASGIVQGNHVSALSLATGVLYILERYKRFNELPIFARRRGLSQKIELLRAELTQKTGEQSKLQNEPARLSQLESQEKSSAYREFKERELASALGRIDISRLTQLKGIGPYVLDNLRTVGFANAYELYRRQWWGVRGIGPKRQSQIRSLLARWKSEAEQRIPNTLPADLDNMISNKYRQQRQRVLDQLGSFGRRINSVRSEMSQYEAELRQLYLPSFGEYLKHNL